MTTENLQLAAQCWCDKETEHLVMIPELAEAFAKRLDEKQKTIGDLQDFAIWLTGCGYDFTQHSYFVDQRDKLLKD